MADLPDFYTSVETGVLEASSLVNGADAAKSANPAVGDVYIATDTKKLYFCAAAGSWTGFDASILIQGVLTLYENMAGGGKQIDNIADPTAAQDAATKKYVDDVDDKLVTVTINAPDYAMDTIYQNTSGKLLMITLSFDLDPGDRAYITIGAASPPTTDILNVHNDTNNNDEVVMPATFIVPVNWYFRIDTVLGSPEILYDQVEWELF